MILEISIIVDFYALQLNECILFFVSTQIFMGCTYLMLLGWFCSKTCVSLAISRIKLLQNKRDVQLKHMRKEIAQFLQAGQEAIARIRVPLQTYD